MGRKKITITIEDDDLPGGYPSIVPQQDHFRPHMPLPGNVPWQLKDFSSAAENARLAFEWYDKCPCNPKNGGSGICGCVNQFSTTIC